MTGRRQVFSTSVSEAELDRGPIVETAAIASFRAVNAWSLCACRSESSVVSRINRRWCFSKVYISRLRVPKLP